MHVQIIDKIIETKFDLSQLFFLFEAKNLIIAIVTKLFFDEEEGKKNN